MSERYWRGDRAQAADTIAIAANMGTEVFYTVGDFFKKYYQKLTVVNGVDTQTNNHDSGTRTTWSGQLDEGYPCFAALATAVVLEKQNIPLAFLSSGGYDNTEGVCSLSRVGNPNPLSVTGEGIETAGQADLLGMMGCNRGQGYLYSRPLAAEDLTALLRSGGHVTPHPATATSNAPWT